MNRKQLRVPGVLLGIAGIALLGVAATTRQIAFVPMGTSLMGAGFVFLIAARRRHG